MAIPAGGKTEVLKEYKAGYARIFLRDVPTVPTFSNTSTLDGAITSSATTVNVATGTGSQFVEGDFVRVDDEIMYVSAVVTDALTVDRGRDGTVAVAHDDEAVICQVAEGISLDTAITSETSEVLDYDGIPLTVDDLLRGERQNGGNERGLVYTAGTPGSVDAAWYRDINLDKQQSDVTYTYTTSEYLIIASQGVKHPFSSSNRATYWHEIESKGGITITTERTTIETQGDQRGYGKPYMDVMRYGITLNMPLTDPVVLSYFDSLNYSITQNGLRKGRTLNYKAGSEIPGLQIAIVGQETVEQAIYWMYDQRMTAQGDVAFTNAHREVEVTLMGNKSSVYNCYGNHTIPLPCS